LANNSLDRERRLQQITEQYADRVPEPSSSQN